MCANWTQALSNSPNGRNLSSSPIAILWIMDGRTPTNDKTLRYQECNSLTFAQISIKNTKIFNKYEKDRIFRTRDSEYVNNT